MATYSMGREVLHRPTLQYFAAETRAPEQQTLNKHSNFRDASGIGSTTRTDKALTQPSREME